MSDRTPPEGTRPDGSEVARLEARLHQTVDAADAVRHHYEVARDAIALAWALLAERHTEPPSPGVPVPCVRCGYADLYNRGATCVYCGAARAADAREGTT